MPLSENRRDLVLTSKLQNLTILGRMSRYMRGKNDVNARQFIILPFPR